MLHQVARQLRLAINHDALAPGQLPEIDAVIAAIEGEREAVMRQALLMHARPGLSAIHQADRAFLQHAGAHAPEDVVLADTVDNDIVDAAPDLATPGPEQVALRNAELRVLGDALAALPAQYREVLVLRELEELSYKQIASIVDIPIGTVMSRLARARGMLQRSPVLYAIGGQTARSGQ